MIDSLRFNVLKLFEAPSRSTQLDYDDTWAPQTMKFLIGRSFERLAFGLFVGRYQIFTMVKKPVENLQFVGFLIYSMVCIVKEKLVFYFLFKIHAQPFKKHFSSFAFSEKLFIWNYDKLRIQGPPTLTISTLRCSES